MAVYYFRSFQADYEVGMLHPGTSTIKVYRPNCASSQNPSSRNLESTAGEVQGAPNRCCIGNFNGRVFQRGFQMGVSMGVLRGSPIEITNEGTRSDPNGAITWGSE